jgi:addiction module HigA family antidote
MVKDIEIIHGKRSITADTALRLARHFGNSPQFWLGLQMDYDLEVPKPHSFSTDLEVPI